MTTHYSQQEGEKKNTHWAVFLTALRFACRPFSLGTNSSVINGIYAVRARCPRKTSPLSYYVEKVLGGGGQNLPQGFEDFFTGC